MASDIKSVTTARVAEFLGKTAATVGSKVGQLKAFTVKHLEAQGAAFKAKFPSSQKKLTTAQDKLQPLTKRVATAATSLKGALSNAEKTLAKKSPSYGKLKEEFAQFKESFRGEYNVTTKHNELDKSRLAKEEQASADASKSPPLPPKPEHLQTAPPYQKNHKL